MAATSVNYQCPNCNAPLTFLPGHDKVTCEYCGTELEIKAVEELYAAKEAAAAKERDKMLKTIGQLTVERNFLQDCFRAVGKPVPELDPEKQR